MLSICRGLTYVITQSGQNRRLRPVQPRRGCDRRPVRRMARFSVGEPGERKLRDWRKSDEQKAQVINYVGLDVATKDIAAEVLK
jgi:hypothetical protein